MALFKKESLEELRGRINLVEVLSPHLSLQKAGGAYKALCPFHDERTPSFLVQPGDQHYHCFGCGAHGDAIQFLMDYLKLSFTDAIETLADQFRITLDKEEKSDGKSNQRHSIKDALFKANQFFQMMLLHSKEGEKALNYLYKRGITLSFIERFGIGFAPPQDHHFKEWMLKNNCDHQNLIDAGLMHSNGHLYFHDRITFPIHHPSGYVVGFSSRKFEEATFGGKYINSPETQLFKKSHILFGLNYSRRKIARERKVLIVEGQIDALRLIESGFDYVVAGQGTAFTENQAELLCRLGIEIVFLAFDADKAGRDAAFKVGELFQKTGIEVKVLFLPLGKDPDLIILEEGAEGFERFLDQAQDYLSFLIKYHSNGEFSLSPASKNLLAKKIGTQVRQWKHPILVHESLKKLAETLNIPSHVLGIREGASSMTRVNFSKPNFNFHINPDRILETDLLRWLILCSEKTPDVIAICERNLKEEDLKDLECKSIFRSFFHSRHQRQSCDILSLAIDLDLDSAQSLLEEIFQKSIPQERAIAGIQQTIQKILDRNWLEQKETIKRSIHEGGQDQEEVFKLIKAYNQLNLSPPSLKLANA